MSSLIGDKTRATLFELEVASWLVEMGWEVEFLKPNQNQRTPDLRIQKNEFHSAVECKRFESEQWEGWAQELSFALLRRIDEEARGSATSFDVLFESRLSDLGWGNPSIRSGIIEELADCMARAVREAVMSTPPRSVRVPGIAEVRLRPDREGSQRGVGGIEVSPQGKMRRIASNGILEAAQQLTGYAPGAVVVRADFTPPKELVDVVMRGLNRADPSLLRSVAVVVITGALGAPAVIWQNPAVAEQPICQALTASFVALANGKGAVPHV